MIHLFGSFPRKYSFLHSTVLAIAALACTGSRVSGESRTFTSVDGRTVDAEVIAADVSNATLKLPDGRQTVTALSRLSSADQDYLKSWIQTHPSAIRYAFSMDWAKERMGSKQDSSTRNSIVTSASTGMLCHFKVTNRATVPLENVEVKIELYEKTLRGEDSYHHYKRTIPRMAAGETVTVDSDPITLSSTQFKGGGYVSGDTYYVYTTSGPLHNADSVRGYSATIHHANRQVFSIESTGFKKPTGKLR